MAEQLVGAIDELMDDYLRRLADEEPEWTRRTELADAVRSLTRASILREAVMLRDGEPLPEECPEADAEFARAAASLDAGPHVLGDAYRRGHACQWDGWFKLVEDRKLEPEARRRLLARASSSSLHTPPA